MPLSACPESGNGEHCDCIDARETQICCFCDKKLSHESPLDFDDDGSEENSD